MEAAAIAQQRVVTSLRRDLRHRLAVAAAASRAAAAAAAATVSGGQPPPPEPPPRSRPTPSQQEMDAVVASVWGSGAAGLRAQRIADHESGDDPNGRNPPRGRPDCSS